MLNYCVEQPMEACFHHVIKTNVIEFLSHNSLFSQLCLYFAMYFFLKFRLFLTVLSLYLTIAEYKIVITNFHSQFASLYHT